MVIIKIKIIQVSALKPKVYRKFTPFQAIIWIILWLIWRIMETIQSLTWVLIEDWIQLWILLKVYKIFIFSAKKNY